MREMKSTTKEAWSVWRKEVLKTKCSWSAVVIRSKITRSNFHQKHLKIIRSWRSSEAGRLKELQEVVQMKIKSRLSLQKIGRIKQRLIQMDLKALDAYSVESVEKWLLYEVYNHYLHYSVLCLLAQEQQLCLQRCYSRLAMNLKMILHRTITISGKWSLVIWSSFKRLYFDVLANSNVFFTPLYKGVKTCCLDTQDSYNNLQVPKLCWNCSASKVHLEFLIKAHILEILES